MTGMIFDIKEFAVHDGGGVRTTVFFKGCPLRCAWCHNPEGRNPYPELMQKSGCEHCGKCRVSCEHTECTPFGRCIHACPKGLLKVSGYEISSDELAEILSRDAELFEMSGGGVTVSGGEPLIQADFLCELLGKLGDVKIHRAIETSGYADADVFRRVICLCDFVYCDLKLIDDGEHMKYTGVSNERILRNIATLRSSGVTYKLRTPLIPGITDTEANLDGIRKFTRPDEVEYLPYNKLAGAKYAMLGLEYTLE